MAGDVAAKDAGKTPSTQSLRNIVILACAVDAADKQLLPATFKALDQEMQLGPSGLAGLALAQNLAFSLALPVWGSLMRYRSAQELMVWGCLLWGASTFMLAMTTVWSAQVFLRLVVGAALASMNPLGQAIICDVVPEQQRGQAFGMLQAACTALSMMTSFGATVSADKDILGIDGWRLAYGVVAVFSLAIGVVLHNLGRIGSPIVPESGRTWLQEQKRVLQAIGGKPTFYMMVLQGVTGSIPWNAFAFLTFFFQLSGYSDLQAGQIILAGGFAGIFGGLLGGWLGDRMSSPDVLPKYGRCFVAQCSVVLGTIFFLWMISIPWGSGSFATVIITFMLFHVCATWTQAAALRPMCGELFTNAQDRAQILALWIALEGTIAAFCGAPLASALAKAFGYQLDTHGASIPADPLVRAQDVESLRLALIGVSVVPWALCAVAWFPMYYTYPRDKLARKEAEIRKTYGSSS